MPPGYRYLGPYNTLHEQVKYDKDGTIVQINDQPSNAIDETATKHDLCYSVNPKNKGECNRQNS